MITDDPGVLRRAEPVHPHPVPAAAPVRVVLANDRELVRTAVKAVLHQAGSLEVVAEATDTDAALRSVLGHKPALLIIDLGLPGRRTALEALSGVDERCPHTRTLVMADEHEPLRAREALRAGAHGYLVMSATVDEMISAIHHVASGHSYLAPSVGAQLALLPERSPLPDGLTARELQVLMLTVLGHTNTEIANQLFLARRTVETHRANLQRKVRCRTRAELVSWATDHGVMNADAIRDLD